MVRTGVTDFKVQSRAKDNKVTKRTTQSLKSWFTIFCLFVDPGDSFVICFFDFNRLPFQSKPAPGSRLVEMSEENRRAAGTTHSLARINHYR